MKKLLFQIAIVITAVAILVTVINHMEPGTYNEPEQAVAQTSTASDTVDALLKDTPIPYPDNVIPGLAPEDVYVDLQRRGFSTKKAGNSDGYGWQWENNLIIGDYKYMVYTFSTKFGYVESVKVSVLVDPPSTVDGCTSFYDMIASLPYDGHNTYQARDFIRKNILKRKAIKVIGRAKWTITTPTKWATIIYIEAL